jgi:hypothetical protein
MITILFGDAPEQQTALGQSEPMATPSPDDRAAV